jgi:hypothetical protein
MQRKIDLVLIDCEDAITEFKELFPERKSLDGELVLLGLKNAAVCLESASSFFGHMRIEDGLNPGMEEE